MKNVNLIFREAFPDEIIERISPTETLEILIKRGIIEKHPSVIIHHKGIIYPSYIFLYENLEDGDTFQVELQQKLYGAGGIGNLEFIDVDNLTPTKKLHFSSDAPKWRKVSIGLNLFGKCINKKCEAYNKEVIYIVGINKRFDFNSNRKEIRCPICSKNFMPITMGFFKCEYQIKGEKLKDGEYVEVDINGKETKGNNFEYYDPYKNETTCWSSLTIFTGHRQKIKYRTTNTI